MLLSKGAILTTKIPSVVTSCNQNTLTCMHEWMYEWQNVLMLKFNVILGILFLFSQVTWCGQVFSDPGTVLCTLITQTLTHLDPSLSSCITEFVKNESNIIEKLIELRQVRDHSVKINNWNPVLCIIVWTWKKENSRTFHNFFIPSPPHPPFPPPKGWQGF